MKPYSYTPRPHLVVVISSVMLLTFLLAACGGPAPSGKTVTPTPSSGAPSTTVPMPPTQTSCPPAGTVRAAVMAPLARGSQNTLVYSALQGPAGGEPTASTLKRYTVSTRTTTDIVTLPPADPQISADGQWVLLHTSVSGQDALQLIRMDGQGLQTLYCSKSRGGFGWIQWSPDKKYVALVDVSSQDQSAWTFTLLNVATGGPQTKRQDSHHVVYLPLKWLDNTHLYTSGLFLDTRPPQDQNLYLFDTNTDNVQPILTSPPLGPPCFDAVNSVDSTQLFSSVASTCETGDHPVIGGPSSIQVRPARGGATRTLYSTPTDAITAIRAASRTTLLLLIQNVNTDNRHNGLWKVNTDGTGFTRLISDAATISDAANEEIGFTHGIPWAMAHPWSDVSGDGAYYSIQVFNHANGPNRLLIGSMNGGAPVTVASGSMEVLVGGWTTM